MTGFIQHKTYGAGKLQQQAHICLCYTHDQQIFVLRYFFFLWWQPKSKHFNNATTINYIVNSQIKDKTYSQGCLVYLSTHYQRLAYDIEAKIKWLPFCRGHFSNVFCFIKIVVFWFKFHWNEQYSSIGSDNAWRQTGAKPLSWLSDQ